MKKVLLLVISAIMLAGCAVTHPRNTSVMFLDYRPYESADFFISPNSYNGDHSVLGELSIDITPAVIPLEKSQSFTDGVYGGGGVKVTKENISSEELLEIAVEEALKLGADGLSNFSVKRIFDVSVVGKTSVTTLSHYEINGVCIRRK